MIIVLTEKPILNFLDLHEIQQLPPAPPANIRYIVHSPALRYQRIINDPTQLYERLEKLHGYFVECDNPRSLEIGDKVIDSNVHVPFLCPYVPEAMAIHQNFQLCYLSVIKEKTNKK